MIRISLPWIVNFIRSVDALAGIERGQAFMEAWPLAFDARNQLHALFGESLYGGSLISSRNSADELYKQLEQFIQSDQELHIPDIAIWQVHEQRRKFRDVFLAELETLPSFFVLPKQPYNTNDLVEAGQLLLPAALSTKVPEAVFDAREAGKALAFELGTSCGFHVFRVLESVVRRYYAELSGSSPAPKQRNLGVYINALGRCEADPKILAALQQLKDLHRNPLVHPEVVISVEEAISIIGMVRSVVAAMLGELPEPPQTTTTAQ